MKHTDDKNTILSEKSLEKTAGTFGTISKLVVAIWAICGVAAGLVSLVVLYQLSPVIETTHILNTRVDAVEKRDIQIESKLDSIEGKVDEVNRYLRNK